MEFKIEILDRNNLSGFKELLRVFENVFEMADSRMPGDPHLESLLQKPDFFCIVASNNDKIIGGLTVYILHGYYDLQPSAYIYDVGVLPAYQRQGVGSRLVGFLIEYCRVNGFSEVFVQAENRDEHAVNFYRKTALHDEIQANQFAYTFRKNIEGNQ